MHVSAPIGGTCLERVLFRAVPVNDMTSKYALTWNRKHPATLAAETTLPGRGHGAWPKEETHSAKGRLLVTCQDVCRFLLWNYFVLQQYENVQSQLEFAERYLCSLSRYR